MIDANPSIALCIVSFNSAQDLPLCLEAVANQTLAPDEIVLVDCASSDDSAEVARQTMPVEIPSQIVELDQNLGFAGGANRAIKMSKASHIVLLNPDTTPDPDFLRSLIHRTEVSSELRIGSVTGRLVRRSESKPPARLDACGMYLVPTWRHLDRGSGQHDRGQFMNPELVFGSTGAASLYSRAALEDVALGDDVFAPEFHSFREDAELCFRLQERNWIVIYEPTAKCMHRRNVTPERRRQTGPDINYHSLKNRYLLRAYHQDLPNFIITLIPTLFRDLLAFVWVISMERTSLPAYGWLWKHRAVIWDRRRQIQTRRLSGCWPISRWFFRRSLPL